MRNTERHAHAGDESKDTLASSEEPDRRDVLAATSSIAMAAGLVASYGTVGLIAARYLFPAKPRAMEWRFVASVAGLRQGESLAFETPAGEKVAVARQGSGTGAEDFIALSSTCPHLGCQVHWEGDKNRFFCPCHNGIFDPSGRATGGPPAEAGQALPRFALKVEQGSLFIEVPSERLTTPEPERKG